jgi:L(+)-tartrate dehydratase beta subunit
MDGDKERDFLKELKMRKASLQIPLKNNDIRNLKIGDLVYLNGLVITGRELFYKHVLEDLNEPPIDIAGQANVQIHCAPAGREIEPGKFRISAIQATASFRYSQWIPKFIAKYGIKAIIGKAGMHEKIYESAFKDNGTIFLTTIGYGLLSATVGKSVEEVEGVYWKEELGLPEALWVLSVKDFGPFLVEYDLEGKSLMGIANRAFSPRLDKLYEQLPEFMAKRRGETHDAFEEIIG